MERAHRSLKQCLTKQKGGIGYDQTAKNRLSLALYTINFLHLDNNNRSAAERHTAEVPCHFDDVKWKDVLSNSWRGPDPVIARSRGAVCVFPQDQLEPIWVPERLTRLIQGYSEKEQDNTTDQHAADLVEPPGGNSPPVPEFPGAGD